MAIQILSKQLIFPFLIPCALRLFSGYSYNVMVNKFNESTKLKLNKPVLSWSFSMQRSPLPRYICSIAVPCGDGQPSHQVRTETGVTVNLGFGTVARCRPRRRAPGPEHPRGICRRKWSLSTGGWIPGRGFHPPREEERQEREARD